MLAIVAAIAVLLLFAAPASAYHGILSKGCGPGLYAPLNYPNNPCIFCPPGRWSNTTNAETRMELKCSGICAEAFVCGCPGSTESGAADSFTMARERCSMCTPGQYDHDNISSTACENCTAGRFSGIVGATQCAGVCADAGTYGAPGQTSSAACEPCSPGRWDHDAAVETAAGGRASTPCVSCDAGRYSDAVGATECAGSCE